MRNIARGATRLSIAAIVGIASSGNAFAQSDEIDSSAEVTEEAIVETVEVEADDEFVEEVSEPDAMTPEEMGEFEEILGDEEGFVPNEGLEQYVAVSSKRTQSVEKSPASVFVITREEIDRAGYQSVGEALSFVPGLFTSYDLVNYHVGMRGIFGGSRSGSRTLKVLVDGRPMTVVQSGTYLLGREFIPMSSIERIEIMRGPASALYGQGALEGAINVVTKRPPYEGETTVSGQVSMAGGAFGLSGGAVDATAMMVTENTMFMLSYSGSQTDRSGLSIPAESEFYDHKNFNENNTPLLSRNDISKPQVVLAKVQANLGGGRLDARALAQFSNSDAEFYDITVFSGGSRLHFYNANTALSYEKPFASGYAIKAAAAYTKSAPLKGDRFFVTNKSIPAGLVGDGSNLIYRRDFSSDEFTGSLEVHRELGETGLVVMGVDVSHDIENLPQISSQTLNDGTLGTETMRAAPPEQTLTNFAGYGQLLYPVVKDLSLAAGLRFDENSVYGGALTGRLAAVYSPVDQVSIKAMVGRAFKGASPEQLYNTPIRKGDFSGQSDLKPQFINSAELSASVFPARSIKLSATGFFNSHVDALSNILRGGVLVATSFDSTTLGSEIAAQYSATFGENILVNAATAVSLQNTITVETLEAGLPVKPVPNNEIFPKFMWFTKLDAKIPDAYISLYLAHRHIGERVLSQSNLLAAGFNPRDMDLPTLASYDVLDLGLSTTPISIDGARDIVAGIKVQNALDARYSEIGFNGIDVPNLGRVLWAQLKLKF